MTTETIDSYSTINQIKENLLNQLQDVKDRIKYYKKNPDKQENPQVLTTLRDLKNSLKDNIDKFSISSIYTKQEEALPIYEPRPKKSYVGGVFGAYIE